MRKVLRCLVLGALAAGLSACHSEVRADGSGVVFMYHHVDQGTPPSTSISPAVFAEHLDYLEREAFQVLPLHEMLDALANGDGVPDKSVAITFDDGYSSVLTEALPLLEARGWPFTVFVNTEAIDDAYGGYLSWDQIREIGQRGGTIGNHSVTHAHLIRRNGDEPVAEWRQRISDEIETAGARLRSEAGAYTIPVFAYPYGEYTTELKEIVASHGLYGVGQHSGAIGTESDFLALPRYPVATGLGIDEFMLRARSKALPVRYAGSERHVVDEADGRPRLRLALDGTDDIRSEAIACYATGQGSMPLEWHGTGMNEFSIRPERAFDPGRSKINCTAPSANESGVYYWWGHLWIRRLPDGDWYDE